ncbi:MAG: hypothetical protein ACI9SB_001917 [Candidatus Azotimanducaceae bacterium]|jgi:hypothetical protein
MSWQASVQPSFNTAGKGENIGDTKSFKLEGHTGARGFIGSGTAQNDIPVGRNARDVQVN